MKTSKLTRFVMLVALSAVLVCATSGITAIAADADADVTVDMANLCYNEMMHIAISLEVNKEIAEVLETYSYQVGLREGRMSFASAIGFFQSVIGCIMVFTSNWLAKRNGGSGLW